MAATVWLAYILSPVAQIPPTPTAIPASTPQFTVPGVEMWDFAAQAVGSWNSFGSTTTQVIQIVVIALLVFVSIIFVVAQIRSLSGAPGEDAK